MKDLQKDYYVRCCKCNKEIAFSYANLGHCSLLSPQFLTSFSSHRKRHFHLRMTFILTHICIRSAGD